MIPHTLVLKPDLVVHRIYNGYWFWGRPSVYDLWQDLRDASSEIRPDWDLSKPGLREAWESGDLSHFHGWDKRDPEKPDRRGVKGLRGGAERRVRVVVDAGRGELAALTPNVDCHPGLRRSSVLPHRTTLYSSAQVRPSSITEQCSSGMPPPFENKCS